MRYLFPLFECEIETMMLLKQNIIGKKIIL